jgi:hypothetical protein
MRWAASIGILVFAVGGVLLLYAFGLSSTAFVSSFSITGDMINVLAFGFLGFVLLGFGLYLFIEDATSRN